MLLYLTELGVPPLPTGIMGFADATGNFVVPFLVVAPLAVVEPFLVVVATAFLVVVAAAFLVVTVAFLVVTEGFFVVA